MSQILSTIDSFPIPQDCLNRLLRGPHKQIGFKSYFHYFFCCGFRVLSWLSVSYSADIKDSRIVYRIVSHGAHAYVTGVAVEIPQAETVVRGWSEPSYKLAIKADRLWHVATALLHYISTYVCVCVCVCVQLSCCVRLPTRCARSCLKPPSCISTTANTPSSTSTCSARSYLLLSPTLLSLSCHLVHAPHPKHQEVCSDNRILRGLIALPIVQYDVLGCAYDISVLKCSHARKDYYMV